ncbi:response regulator [Marinicella sp. S1101]|uniref:response regulator transcription factor n=1 Tax=Marinicella marina TaxID=2996016 RepID=UPI002260DF5A|nr:response regulator [Marinicella marina]MCX7553010.1 response regulator [Marinicella marina]MDJ1139680.1 response regulator [Marinicella marina]
MSEVGTKNILIIDDDEVLRYSLARALGRFGFKLFEADSIDATKSIINQQPIDWVVLDLRLGAESGLVLAQWLLHEKPELKIVMITGYAAVSTAVEAIKIGVTNYLIKPVNVEEIIQAFVDQPESVDHPINAQPLSPKRLEWEHIQKVLLQHDGNISQAARALKMHRRTLQRKLQKKPVKE